MNLQILAKQQRYAANVHEKLDCEHGAGKRIKITQIKTDVVRFMCINGKLLFLSFCSLESYQ